MDDCRGILSNICKCLYSYPMELHMVFYKSEYESMEEAMKNKDGLLVLALFYEVCKQLFQVYLSLHKYLFIFL